MKTLFLLILFMCTNHTEVLAAFKVKEIISSGDSEILSVSFLKKKINGEKIILKSHPYILDEFSSENQGEYRETLYQDDRLPPRHAYFYSKNKRKNIELLDSEVKILIKQGDPNNRINLTILGDGYTLEEKDKFFSDAERITNDLFTVETFSNYLPLFNVYAVFLPSKDSGITDIIKKDTVYGLYRSPRGSKRGIMPGNRGMLERAIDLAPATDFPIVIANDDYYGGLGGRYAITTRSLTSGSMVLRHELGHNFGDVGEEYDGGYTYRGANFSRSPSPSWRHWIGDEEDIVFKSKFLTGSYVWKNLKNGDFVKRFSFPGNGRYFFKLKLSSVGWATSEDVEVYLDDQKLDLEGVFTNDRSFFDNICYS